MKSIASKLWFGMMVLIAVALILLWLFQIVFLNHFYTKIRVNEVKNLGLEIAKDIGKKEEFINKLDKLAYDNNLTATLIDSNGNTLHFAGTPGMDGQMPMMMNSLRTEAYSNVLKGETVLSLMTHPRFGSKFMLIGLPANASGKIQGALMITLPLAPVEDTVSILKKQLIYITLILLAATLLISYYLSRSFTRPILDIIKVSLNMASGDLDARIKTTRKDEIGRLAETINYMGNELSKIEQLRKDLIANVSHELRTPLSLIKGYAETIRDVSGDNAEKREKQLDIIIEEADRLSGIVEDILKFSQMQSGYMDLHIDRFRLDQTLERVVKKYEVISQRTGIGISQKVNGEVYIYGDEQRIEQVLHNLMNNAFSHSPEGSTITIAVSENINKIKIEIKDEGEGIPKDEIPYVWNRFYKVDKSGKRKQAGTGLGLAIVKSILTAHKAAFGVESGIEKGTTFWFEFNKV
ncbi:MAG: HAMP domain-containing histidine kinase [Clostridia bacterium]|nr:HAMP domain-containing histidine kinase [Clostridia bacterium]